MEIIETVARLREALKGERDVNFVPTMGHLHAGHVSLVRLAAQQRGVVVTSIFVNPLQFSPHEDFGRYPRSLASDAKLLSRAGCDILFAPGDEEMYPEPQVCKVQPPAALKDILEGRFRPGFFVGVATVVLKLFGMVRPSLAVFGKKDYQQLLVIQNMVRQLALPVEIVAGETVRDTGGLALSSRNSYLSAAERKEAIHLSIGLRSCAEQVQAGQRDWNGISNQMVESLKVRGWRPDYVVIRRRSDLGVPRLKDELVVLGAARLGNTRLIDNIEI